MNEEDELLRAKLNLETAQISWRELQRFFAMGTAIAVSPGLDLVEVAFHVTRDNAPQAERWLAEKKVGPVSDSQAQEWFAADALLWSIVVKPWVLVQSK